MCYIPLAQVWSVHGVCSLKANLIILEKWKLEPTCSWFASFQDGGSKDCSRIRRLFDVHWCIVFGGTSSQHKSSWQVTEIEVWERSWSYIFWEVQVLYLFEGFFFSRKNTKKNTPCILNYRFMMDKIQRIIPIFAPFFSTWKMVKQRVVPFDAGNPHLGYPPQQWRGRCGNQTCYRSEKVDGNQKSHSQSPGIRVVPQ